MPERLIVIGGDAGGMTAASQARRMRAVDSLEIVAFERGRHTSYSACGIPYFIGDEIHDADRLVVRSPEQFAARSIDVRLRHEVVAIDTAARRVTTRNLDEGSESAESYDLLMIATGSTPKRPPIPGIELPGIFGVQTLDDGIAVRSAIDDRKPSSAVIVGGGYIGLELAEALATRGVSVS